MKLHAVGWQTTSIKTYGLLDAIDMPNSIAAAGCTIQAFLRLVIFSVGFYCPKVTKMFMGKAPAKPFITALTFYETV